LPTNKEINIDSKIDGNMEIALESVSLDKLLLKKAITKIETKTLDRLLLLLIRRKANPPL
jgi:hypothetical protein